MVESFGDDSLNGVVSRRDILFFEDNMDGLLVPRRLYHRKPLKDVLGKDEFEDGLFGHHMVRVVNGE